MPHRMQVVAEQAAGVTYVDDSKATNPAAVAAALASFEVPVVLILGGSEKDTDFAEVLPDLQACRAVVCQGEAGPRIAAYLEDAGWQAWSTRSVTSKRPSRGRGAGEGRGRRPALPGLRELRPVRGLRREGRRVRQVRA